MKVTKAIRFTYFASEELQWLFEEFRLMCNDAIRIAIRESPKNRFDLIRLAYERLKTYGLHSHYILAACEVAHSSYKNKRRRSIPHIAASFLKLDNQSYQLTYLLLRIPSRPRRFIYISLDGSNYHRSFLSAEGLKRGSVTISKRSVVIAFSKEVTTEGSKGRMGIDLNEKNVTWSDSAGRSESVDISNVSEIRERYREIRAKIAKRTHKDARINRELQDKYGARERNRTIRLIHALSKALVQHAKTNNLAIKMENLKGIRRRYRRGNGHTASFRSRMNSWAFGEIQRQVTYKALWEGVQVDFINPRGTSRNCPDCGSRVAPLSGRRLFCAKCDITWDRDVLASKNIMMAAPMMVRAARPLRCSRDSEPKEQR